MKFFLDSALLSEIEQAYSTGICDGITMNPSLVKKAVDGLKADGERIDLEKYIKKALKTAKGTPVSLEVTDIGTAKAMVEQGKKLFKKFNPVAKNVYIKIPVNPAFDQNPGKDFDGIRAINELHKAKIPVNCTLVFTPEQALAAAKAGADFVSPFAGRIDDMLRKEHSHEFAGFSKEDYYPLNGHMHEGKMLEDNGIVSGIDLVAQIVSIFRRYGIKSQVLAASLRNARQVREAAIVGADIATMPFGVFRELARHRLTVEGMKKFTEDTPEEFRKLV
ncbi:MAG: transaldolase [Candidatus Diapherotrites archaeon]|uniref:Transaldolase n=1 Tax=Candidatus Iainarchaeum sp. TaxID=3101447 RepID=A0A8T3YHL6_9ARCH|nr:transaldolase [Candidatus Diapherotrites archaeon]